MDKLQTIIEQANQTAFKNDKHTIEVSFSTNGNIITGKVYLVDSFSLRTEIADIKYKKEDYDYNKAIYMLGDKAVERLCIVALKDIYTKTKV